MKNFFYYALCIFCVYNVYLIKMRKNIDIDENLIPKLKLIALFENISVKALMEKVIQNFVTEKEKSNPQLSDLKKEDLGLWLLMQEANRDEKVSRQDVFKALEE
ncbi:MAG TPA: hypothetical protein VFD29_05335 [Gillisia sp.]|nr:hypothetical protein [Gillisia sp.]